MDQVCAVNKSIYTVNPGHFLVFRPFRSMEFKCYWNRCMGARDNKGGGGLNGQEVEVLKGIGGGTQRCLIIAMGESQETQDPGQTQEAGGFDPLLPSPPPSFPPPPPPPCSIKFGENRGRMSYGRWKF